MPRVWNTPIFAIATVYFNLDGVFSYVTQPITAWFRNKKLLSISLFAWGYGYWRRMLDLLESTAAWRASRQMISKLWRWSTC